MFWLLVMLSHCVFCVIKGSIGRFKKVRNIFVTFRKGKP